MEDWGFLSDRNQSSKILQAKHTQKIHAKIGIKCSVQPLCSSAVARWLTRDTTLSANVTTLEKAITQKHHTIYISSHLQTPPFSDKKNCIV